MRREEKTSDEKMVGEIGLREESRRLKFTARATRSPSPVPRSPPRRACYTGARKFLLQTIFGVWFSSPREDSVFAVYAAFWRLWRR